LVCRGSSDLIGGSSVRPDQQQDDEHDGRREAHSNENAVYSPCLEPSPACSECGRPRGLGPAGILRGRTHFTMVLLAEQLLL
jgi:hypothetical protein